MVVKVYISGISGNKEVKKHQQRVLMILDSKSIEYVTVDITDPDKEEEKEFMQQNGKAKDSKHPLPPQLFNEEDYCGDYEEFDLANENDELDKFLKVAPSISKAEITLEKTGQLSPQTENKSPVENGEINGTSSSREHSSEKEPAAKSEESEERREEKSEPVEQQQREDETAEGGEEEEEEEEKEEE